VHGFCHISFKPLAFGSRKFFISVYNKDEYDFLSRPYFIKRIFLKRLRKYFGNRVFPGTFEKVDKNWKGK